MQYRSFTASTRISHYDLIKCVWVNFLLSTLVNAQALPELNRPNYYSKNCKTNANQPIPCSFVGINIDIAREHKPECPKEKSGREIIDIPAPETLNGMGTDWIRQDSGWLDIHAQNIGKEKAYQQLAQYRKNKINIILIVYKDYYQRAKYILDNFGPIIGAWQIDNEPDIPIAAWNRDIVPPRTYANQLKKAYSEIRQAYKEYYQKNYPNLKRPKPPIILTAGLVKESTDYLSSVIRYAPELPFDGIALHFYGIDTNTYKHPYHKDPKSRNQTKLKDMLHRFNAVAQGIPLWVTEIGMYQEAPHTNLTSTYMGAVYQDAANAVSEGVKLQAVVWFAWHDVSYEGPWGIVDGCGDPKLNLFNTFKGISLGIQ